MFTCGVDGFQGWSGCPAGNQYLPGERSASEPRWNGRRGRKGTAYTAGFSDLKDALIRKLLWSQVSKGRSCGLKPVMHAGFLLPTRVVVPSSDFHTHVGHQGPACPSVGKMGEDMSWYQQLRIIGTSYFRTGGQGRKGCQAEACHMLSWQPGFCQPDPAASCSSKGLGGGMLLHCIPCAALRPRFSSFAASMIGQQVNPEASFKALNTCNQI